MFISYHGGWRKKCPACNSALWSEDYPEIFKSHNPNKTYKCPKCSTSISWLRSKSIKAKYSLLILGISGSVSSYFIYLGLSNIEKVDESIIIAMAISCLITILAFIGAVFYTLTNELSVNSGKP